MDTFLPRCPLINMSTDNHSVPLHPDKVPTMTTAPSFEGNADHLPIYHRFTTQSDFNGLNQRLAEQESKGATAHSSSTRSSLSNRASKSSASKILEEKPEVEEPSKKKAKDVINDWWLWLNRHPPRTRRETHAAMAITHHHQRPHLIILNSHERDNDRAYSSIYSQLKWT